ncbi:phosphatidate cytidylyltransferase, partial [Rickettsiales bacterium]|nr:phosphatidate cytidylyltransferase [Rickettsiales bacterium]
KNFEFIFVYMLAGYFLYLVFNIKKNIYQYFGIIYLSLPFFGFLYFQKIDQLITNFVLIFIITVCTDVGGFVMGKLLKGPKILKKISPKKTWSGFVGGILFSVVISELFYENIFGSFKICILVCLFSFICQVGDFIESYFKRLCNVKESSNLIPGHGGILDRLDGAILLTIFIFVLNIFQINFLQSFVYD